MGCITCVLLFGYNPFDNELQPIHESLMNLEEEMEASDVGPRVRDFVRSLLDVDDTTRMDAKAALQHYWLHNSSHNCDLNAAYQISVAHWQPRPAGAAEILDLSDDHPITGSA